MRDHGSMSGAAGLTLTPDERLMLTGERGPAVATAMAIIVRVAEAARAERLVPIVSAHIDGCLYHGSVGLDLAELLAREGGRVAVPTTLNVSSLDLLHPEIVRLEPAERERARRQMDAYTQMGCQPSWTCAPYQLAQRPSFGEHVAWAESNAIVFANSVLGARTNRYGDFMDICAALTGRVPDAGLHRPEGRRAGIVFEIAALAPEAYGHDELFAALGHLIGLRAGSTVPAVVGLPAASEDQLKHLGAAAASSGAVALCHVVGVTPEAPTLADALGGQTEVVTVRVTPTDLRAAWSALSTAVDGVRLGAVSVGTPHFSLAEFERLTPLLRGARLADGVTFYVSTGRHLLPELERRGWLQVYRQPGVQLVTDTCTYVTPIIGSLSGALMTNSAKWAWYAPGNLGADVCFGTLEDCVRSAVEGRVVREPPTWLDG